MKVFLVNSAGGSSYWNYAPDTFYNNSTALKQVKVSAENMWLTTFIVIMQMGKGGMTPFTNYA